MRGDRRDARPAERAKPADRWRMMSVMARLPRLELPGWPHLVCLQVVADDVLVRDAEDRKALWVAMVSASRSHPVAVHAYAVTAAALWVVVTPAEPGALGVFMQAIGRRYVAAFNHRHDRKGSLWAGRFRAAPLDPARYLLEAMLLVETRPDAGPAGEPGTSSLAHHLHQRTDALVQDHARFWALGNTPFEREAAWRRWLDAGVSAADAADLTAAVLKGWALAPADRLGVMAAGASRRVAPRPRGRPRKTPVGESV